MLARVDGAEVRKLSRPSPWRILFESKVRAHPIVIVGEPFDRSSQVLLTQDNRVIRAFSPDGADDSFCIRVLPRRTRGRQHFA